MKIVHHSRERRNPEAAKKSRSAVVNPDCEYRGIMTKNMAVNKKKKAGSNEGVNIPLLLSSFL